MATNLTPSALQELDELMWSSRRKISSVYRYWKMGHAREEIAQELSESNLSKIDDSTSTLKILFGRKSLPTKGSGRQDAIYEADFWLKSNLHLSAELEDHFRQLLSQAGRTNLRANYVTPDYRQGRYVSHEQGGVYIVSRKSFVELHRVTQKPLVLKLGWSINVWDRLAGAQTWDPDPLEILRIFPCHNPNIVEAKFHICLDTLNLGYGTPGGGREWFSTNLSLIDNIAQSLNLSNTIDSEDLTDWHSDSC
jgi:hypothetical protein